MPNFSIFNQKFIFSPLSLSSLSTPPPNHHHHHRILICSPPLSSPHHDSPLIQHKSGHLSSLHHLPGQIRPPPPLPPLPDQARPNHHPSTLTIIVLPIHDCPYRPFLRFVPPNHHCPRPNQQAYTQISTNKKNKNS